jgi:hypothetical protein
MLNKTCQHPYESHIGDFVSTFIIARRANHKVLQLISMPEMPAERSCRTAGELGTTYTHCPSVDKWFTKALVIGRICSQKRLQNPLSVVMISPYRCEAAFTKSSFREA